MSAPGGKLNTESSAYLDTFYRTYIFAIRRYFTRHLKDKSEAEDLAHDLLVKIAHKMHAEDIRNPEAFIFAAASNVLKDRLRHGKVVETYLSDALHADGQVEEITPERVLLSKQSLDRLLTGLRSLDQKTRRIFILHRFEGLKHSEIAQLYGVSVSSVEKYMIRALQHLANNVEL